MKRKRIDTKHYKKFKVVFTLAILGITLAVLSWYLLSSIAFIPAWVITVCILLWCTVFVIMLSIKHGATKSCKNTVALLLTGNVLLLIFPVITTLISNTSQQELAYTELSFTTTGVMSAEFVTNALLEILSFSPIIFAFMALAFVIMESIDNHQEAKSIEIYNKSDEHPQNHY